MSENKKKVIEYVLSAAGMVLLLMTYLLAYHSYQVKTAVVIQAVLCAIMVTAGGFYSKKHNIVSIAGRVFFYVATMPLLDFSWLMTFMYIKSFDQSYMALLASGIQKLGHVIVPVAVFLVIAAAVKKEVHDNAYGKNQKDNSVLKIKDFCVLAVCLMLFVLCMFIPRYYLVWWYLIGCGVFLVCCGLWEKLMADEKKGFLFRVVCFSVLLVRAMYIIIFKSFIYTLPS